MNSNYKRNKELAKYRDDTPTLTDQASAKDTDINVIVGGFLRHGTVPGTTKEAMYEDFSQLPEDLRGFIERGRTIETNRGLLPEVLRTLPIDELLALTPETLREKLVAAQPIKQMEAETPKGEEEKK